MPLKLPFRGDTMGKKNTEIKVVPLRQPTKMISTRLPQYLIDYVDEIRDVKRLGPKAIGRSEQIRTFSSRSR